MFPPGLPGLALLLLRASVATTLLADNYSHAEDLPGWIQAAAILISVAVSVGYLTPIVAVLGLVLHAVIRFRLGIAILTPMTFFDAIALALLGPGAYSVDSYLFGRRLVILPPP
jgi:hypothetical protein